MGLPVEFDVSKLGVDIGPDDRDVVQLDMQANAELKLLMISYPASVYRLDTSDPKIALLSKAPLDIKVSKGKITLVPKLN